MLSASINSIGLNDINIKSMGNIHQYVQDEGLECAHSDVEIRHRRSRHAMLALMPEYSVTLTIPRGDLKRLQLRLMKWAILKFYVPSQGLRRQDCFPWRCSNCYFAPP